jgi:hypothetical protein
MMVSSIKPDHVISALRNIALMLKLGLAPSQPASSTQNLECHYSLCPQPTLPCFTLNFSPNCEGLAISISLCLYPCSSSLLTCLTLPYLCQVLANHCSSLTIINKTLRRASHYFSKQLVVPGSFCTIFPFSSASERVF